MTRIVYVSTDSMPFVPVEVTDPYVPDRTEYPLVLEEPNGIAQPKYDWANSEWTEDHTGSIADQLSALQDNVSDLTDALALSITGGVVSTSESDTADELPSMSTSESDTADELSSTSTSESDTTGELPSTSTSESDTTSELSSTSASEA